MKDKTTAALLAFFLGGFGIHRFYLGRSLSGFMYLIFCWTLIPALFGFVEFILLLVMGQAEFDAKYNAGMVRQANQINVVVNNSAEVGAPRALPAPQARMSVTAELRELNDLRQQGALTEEEFEVQKRKLLGHG